jgi:hypothetical protein
VSSALDDLDARDALVIVDRCSTTGLDDFVRYLETARESVECGDHTT